MDKWNLIIEVGRCENCHNCVIAERDEHIGNDYPGYAAPASLADEAPIRILRRVQGSAPMLETTYLPVLCNHCDDAPCIKVGGDAIRKRSDGIVVIDPIKAKGRKDIVTSCPYQAIVWNEEQQLPQTWIFDAHLLDAGWPQIRCVQVCPTDVFEAVKLSDESMRQMAREENLHVLQPELGTKPRVYYRHLERWKNCFIGGSVSATINGKVDCVVGAQVTLRQGCETLSTITTNDFGDFRFDGLAAKSGPYQIDIQHSLGHAQRQSDLVDSVYLGEIPLHASGANSPATQEGETKS